MSALLADLKQQAGELSAVERASLAEMLLESLQDTWLPEVESAWHDEIQKRVANYEQGISPIYPAQDVFAEVRRMAL